MLSISRVKVLMRLDATPVSTANLADEFRCTVDGMEKVLGQLEFLGAAIHTEGLWTRAARPLGLD